MSIDTMTGLTFIFLILTIIFGFFRKRKLSLIFAILSLAIFTWANWSYLYLFFLSFKDLFKR